MSTATQIAARIAYRVHDSGQEEVDAAGYLSFLNDAVEDLNAAGWLLPIAEAEVAQTASTYEFNIPASFAYIKEVRLEGASGVYDQVIPYWAWDTTLADSTPVVRIDSRRVTPDATKKYLVIGQKRPAAYVGATTIESGLVGFLRERGVSYAAAYVAGGNSEYAAQRRELAEIAFRNSELMLQNTPEEFRVIPGSRPVPTR